MERRKDGERFKEYTYHNHFQFESMVIDLQALSLELSWIQDFVCDNRNNEIGFQILSRISDELEGVCLGVEGWYRCVDNGRDFNVDFDDVSGGD